MFFFGNRKRGSFTPLSRPSSGPEFPPVLLRGHTGLPKEHRCEICVVVEVYAVGYLLDAQGRFGQKTAALIYEASRNMGFIPEGMSDAQMDELKEAFGL